MANRLTELLRSLFARAAPDARGVLRVGGTSYNAQGWGFTRVANSVYGNPTGYRCVEAIVNNFSRPDWCLFKPGTHERVESHPLLDVLNNPWPDVSGTMLQRDMARDLELNGRSFHLKMRGRDGYQPAGPVTGLRRLAPQRVTVFGDENDQLLGFVYVDRKGTLLPVVPEDMVYLRYPHPERQYDGLAPAIIAGLPAETDNVAMKFNFDLLANDGALPGYFLIEEMSIDEFVRWKASWESGEYPGKTRFIGSGKAQYVKVGQSNQEMTYSDLREASALDMMRAFGVPPVATLDLSHETFANADAELSNMIRGTILPKWTLVGDELSAQLGIDMGVDVGFDLAEIDELTEGTDSLVDRSIKLIDSKVITINELREQLGLDPVQWGEAPEQPAAPMQPMAMPPGTTALLAPPAPEPTDEQIEAEVAAVSARLGNTARRLLSGIQEPAPPHESPHPWIAFDRRVTAYERRAQRRMAAFFARQGRVIAARVAHGRGKAHVAALDTDQWWDNERWIDELREDLTDMYLDTIDAFGTDVMDKLPTPAPFDPKADPVTAYITSRSTDVAGLVNGTTEHEIRQLIAQSEADGLGIDDIAGAVRAYFDGSEGRAAYRAEMFARTEVIGASNFGLLEGARQSGVATAKTWLTAGGGECVDCGGLDGETVGLDDSFSDGNDAPPDHPNCRCTVLIQTGDGQGIEVDDGE